MLHRALIIVDVQNDFCEPSGSLAVKGSNEIFSVINALKKPSNNLYKVVFLTCDMHPPNHFSFSSVHPGELPFTSIQLSGRRSPLHLWPTHCVQGTEGAKFHSALELADSDIVIAKGRLENVESFSGFGGEGEKTELLSTLRLNDITQIDIVGLAFDYCVKDTAFDAIKHGFSVRIIDDATKSVAKDPTPIKKALEVLVRLIVLEASNLPNFYNPRTPPYAYIKIKWNGDKLKTDIDTTHKWNKEFLLEWRKEQESHILNIEVWTSYPGPNGGHKALGSVPIELTSLRPNAISRAVYGLVKAPTCPSFESTNPTLRLQIQLLDREIQPPFTRVEPEMRFNGDPAKFFPPCLGQQQTSSSGSSLASEIKNKMIDQMLRDSPHACREDVELALQRANWKLDLALEHLTMILANKCECHSSIDSSESRVSGCYTDGSSGSACESQQIEEKKMQQRDIFDCRNSRKKKDEKKRRTRPQSHEKKSLESANRDRRRKREQKRYDAYVISPPKECKRYSLTGTQRKLSIPVEDRMKELLPYCSNEEIKRALKKHNGDADAAMDELLDARILEVGQTLTAQGLSSTAMMALTNQEFTQSFVDFLTNEAKAPCGQQLISSVAPLVSDSPDNFVMDSGRRKALLIGINYIGSNKELKGCIEDTRHMRRLITTVYGFPDIDTTITVLTDDNPNPALWPTRKNILLAFSWLISDAEPGSVLFLHYSGHGGQKRNLTGTEVDGFDETIMPLDYGKNGHIRDNDIFKHLVAPLKSGVRLTCLLDCCHSGSAMDLPFVWSGVSRTWKQEPQPKFSYGDVQVLAGCADEETSADFHIPQRECGGAMTKALRQALATNPFSHTYPSLMDTIGRFLKAWGFQQRPQLSSSQNFTLNRPFSLNNIVPNTNPLVGPLEGRYGNPSHQGYFRPPGYFYDDNYRLIPSFDLPMPYAVRIPLRPTEQFPAHAAAYPQPEYPRSAGDPQSHRY